MLGTDTLKAIREDMERLSLPSWFPPAPSHPGEVKWGKFKAAEWKSFCTVNLPITLTRLWGSLPMTDRRYLMLQNFLQLVAAIKLANGRTITIDQIDQYERHMRKYLTGLVELYPWISITPYQHMALHFPSHLRRFGPTHSWRCFAFERYNGLIQNIPTNSRFGEMEITKFNRFIQAQNLRAIFSKCQVPSEVQPILEAFEKRHQTDIYSTFMHDGPLVSYSEPDVEGWQNQNLTALPKEHRALLHNWLRKADSTTNPSIVTRVFAQKKVDRAGQTFECGQGNNSHVVFRPHLNGELSAGVILSIFSHAERQRSATGGITRTFVILQEYGRLSIDDQRLDVFRLLPTVTGFLCDHEPQGPLVLLPFSDVIGHFAGTIMSIPGIERVCMHVLPLSSSDY